MITIALPCRADNGDPDRALVEAMAGGDPAALAELCRSHGSHVLAYLVGQLGDRGAAEDAAQEVMLAAWRGAGGFRGDSRVRTWLLGIAHHLAANVRRRNGRAPALADGVDPARRGEPVAHADASDVRIDLRDAIRRLPPEQRAALDLVFFHGLSVDETACVLGIAPGTVKSRLHRARATMRERLGASYERDV